MKQEMTGQQWHQMDQIICTSLQTDKNASTSSVITQFFTGLMLFLTPNQQCHSTEGTTLCQRQ